MGLSACGICVYQFLGLLKALGAMGSETRDSQPHNRSLNHRRRRHRRCRHVAHNKHTITIMRMNIQLYSNFNHAIMWKLLHPLLSVYPRSLRLCCDVQPAGYLCTCVCLCVAFDAVVWSVCEGHRCAHVNAPCVSAAHGASFLMAEGVFGSLEHFHF